MEVTLSPWIPHNSTSHGFLQLLTLHKCHCSHPVQICDSLANYTHFLTRFQQSPFLANGPLYGVRKELHYQKWRPYMYIARQLFSKLICAKEEWNGSPSTGWGFPTAKPRRSRAVCYLRVHPPTSPCPALSAGTETIVHPKSPWTRDVSRCRDPFASEHIQTFNVLYTDERRRTQTHADANTCTQTQMDIARQIQSELHSVCGRMQPQGASRRWTFVQGLSGRTIIPRDCWQWHHKLKVVHVGCIYLCKHLIWPDSRAQYIGQ